MPVSGTREERLAKQRGYSRAYYARHKEHVKAKVKKWNLAQRRALRKMIDDYKSTHPCSDCGQMFPPYVMQFDHIPERGEKHANVTDMVSRVVSFEKMLAEMEKCDLVCANHHAIRTHKRMARKKAEKQQKT